MVRVTVLRQHAVSGRPGNSDFVLHRVELVRQVQDMAGHATRMSQVVGIYEEDSQIGAGVFPTGDGVQVRGGRLYGLEFAPL